jgi:hypothetical protein
VCYAVVGVWGLEPRDWYIGLAGCQFLMLSFLQHQSGCYLAMCVSVHSSSEGNFFQLVMG